MNLIFKGVVPFRGVGLGATPVCLLTRRLGTPNLLRPCERLGCLSIMLLLVSYQCCSLTSAGICKYMAIIEPVAIAPLHANASGAQQ